MPPRRSLAGQFLLLQLVIVLLVAGVVAAVSLAESDANFRRVEGRRLLAVGENVSANDTIRLLLTDQRASDAIAAIAETSRAYAGVSFVQVVDATGRQLNGPEAGRPATGVDLGPALSGRAGVDVATAATRSLVATVPVLDASDGRVIGAVIVGRTYPTWLDQLGASTSQLVTYLLIGGALGVVGSLLLSARIKRQTLGLEPQAIASLVEQREAMLHGIREGVIGTDASNKVTLVNGEALRLLGLPENSVGRSLHRLAIDPEVVDVLTGKRSATDEVVLGRDHILVLNRMPVMVRGRQAGWITTLRDRTELTSLQRELEISRTATDTLRAQAHEFTNRLHIIAGLVQLGDYDEAIRFITHASTARERLSEQVSSRIADPALAALLIAKTSLAAEQGATLTISPATWLCQLDEECSADLATVVGNLVDNALDAAGIGGRVDIAIQMVDDQITVSVHDSGPGVPPERTDDVFEPGYTTKPNSDGHNGLGLALTRRVCVRRGGSITIDGSTFTATMAATTATVVSR
jgi:two-component system, CitB family, sensor kinase